MDSRSDTTVNINAKKEAANFIHAAYRNFEALGLESSLSNVVKGVVDANYLHVDVDE
jgi:hypothetical protein